jgi:RNA polymerase sigma-70 factor, ECF subfamily
MPNLALPAVDEKVLIRQTRSGSMEALGDLYARYSEAVYRMALRILGSSAEAEDVLQDVFVGLPSTLRRFDEEHELGPWLRRVAARVALSRVRSTGRRDQRERSYASERPDASTAQVDRCLFLERALQEVPESLRPVLLLKEVEGYSHDEIADLLSITPGASAVRLHRALKILRQALRKFE